MTGKQQSDDMMADAFKPSPEEAAKKQAERDELIRQLTTPMHKVNNKPIHEADARDTTLTVYAETEAVVLEVEMAGAVIRLRLDAAHVRGIVLDLRSALAELERRR